eukprot:TRINITY_DN887_c0_g1_i1.p1 TRINITY_DN887_c0_g1~~TRINITY_DN887_c0_g1_i1.p1  ORF type:complete len:104 (-),score=7.98 TRINITY_DN887_c0_g1_i1:11-322(-)
MSYYKTELADSNATVHYTTELLTMHTKNFSSRQRRSRPSSQASMNFCRPNPSSHHILEDIGQPQEKEWEPVASFATNRKMCQTPPLSHDPGTRRSGSDPASLT